MKNNAANNNDLLSRNVLDILGSLSLIDIAFIVLICEAFNAVIGKVYPSFNQNGFLVRYLPGIIFGIIIDFKYTETLNQSADFLVTLFGLVFLIILVNRVKQYV